MRPAVLAAILVFDARLDWTRRPLRAVGRRVGGVVMGWMDRRRQLVNERWRDPILQTPRP